MSKLILSVLFALLVLCQVTILANEGEIEPLMVPQDAVSQEQSQDEAVTEEEPMHQEVIQTNEVPKEAEVLSKPVLDEVPKEEHDTNEAPSHTMMKQEATEQVTMPEADATQPSIEEQEAKHAEEAELREVGAGEEPTEE